MSRELLNIETYLASISAVSVMDPQGTIFFITCTEFSAKNGAIIIAASSSGLKCITLTMITGYIFLLVKF
jgi:hypothetical protein